MVPEAARANADTDRSLSAPPRRVPAATTFQPPWMLRNAHVQSILPSVPPRRWFIRTRARVLRTRCESWLLDCGAFGRLQAYHTRAPRSSDRAALLLHGWEGSADASYVLSLGALLLEEGYHVVRLNLRDHGGTQHLNRELFHSCRLPEVALAVQEVARRLPDLRLYAAGFSLGGNFLLRVAAEPSPPPQLAAVVAVSPVLDPSHTLDALEDAALYHGYFVRRWSRSLRLKQRLWPDDFEFDELLRSRNLRRMTDELVRQHTDFADCKAYLDGYAIIGKRLASLKVPAHILMADDDPIIPSEDIVQLAATPLLHVVRQPLGGHCGFMDSWRYPSFADRFVRDRFAATA